MKINIKSKVKLKFGAENNLNLLVIQNNLNTNYYLSHLISYCFFYILLKFKI